MTQDHSPLALFGWQPFFAGQVSAEDMVLTPPLRVIEVNRKGLHAVGDDFDMLVPAGPNATVGDWLLLDRAEPALSKVLDRKSLFQRRAPGTEWKFQLIAANVDTAFIVSSCNPDFNVARLERYIALAFEAEVTPVIVLTKADLCGDPAPYVSAAAAISPRVPVVLLNALSGEPRDKLREWCQPGQTVVFLGSSGVGKSSLVNALFGDEAKSTAPIREDDALFARRLRGHRHARHAGTAIDGCGGRGGGRLSGPVRPGGAMPLPRLQTRNRARLRHPRRPRRRRVGRAPPGPLGETGRRRTLQHRVLGRPIIRQQIPPQSDPPGAEEKPEIGGV
jgi:ribosome biogenesis GTPase